MSCILVRWVHLKFQQRKIPSSNCILFSDVPFRAAVAEEIRLWCSNKWVAKKKWLKHYLNVLHMCKGGGREAKYERFLTLNSMVTVDIFSAQIIFWVPVVVGLIKQILTVSAFLSDVTSHRRKAFENHT